METVDFSETIAGCDLVKLVDADNELYPRHLCRRVYSFRLSGPLVCSLVRSFVEFASKFCLKVSQAVYISATTYQKAFIFGP